VASTWGQDPAMGSAAWQQIRKRMRTLWMLQDARCARCNGRILYEAKYPDPLSLVCGHRISRAQLRREGREDMIFDTSLLQPEHWRCSRRSGSAEGARSAARRKRRVRAVPPPTKSDPRWVVSDRW
jgi:hypothetical protein